MLKNFSIEDDEESTGKFLCPTDMGNASSRKITVPEKAERRRLSFHGR